VPDSQKTTTEDYDVAIVGGGPAGCAAGVFCRRVGLDTVVVSNGRSTRRKCAFVEDYLGFPAGIEPRSLLELVERLPARGLCDGRGVGIGCGSGRGRFRSRPAPGIDSPPIDLSHVPGPIATTSKRRASKRSPDPAVVRVRRLRPTTAGRPTSTACPPLAGSPTPIIRQSVTRATVLAWQSRSSEEPTPTPTTTGAHPTAATDASTGTCRSASKRSTMANDGGVPSARPTGCGRSPSEGEHHRSTPTRSPADVSSGTFWWAVSHPGDRTTTTQRLRWLLFVTLVSQGPSRDATSYTRPGCDAQFRSAAGVTRHVALHHDTCAECDGRFDDADSLRDHIQRATERSVQCLLTRRPSFLAGPSRSQQRGSSHAPGPQPLQADH